MSTNESIATRVWKVLGKPSYQKSSCLFRCARFTDSRYFSLPSIIVLLLHLFIEVEEEKIETSHRPLLFTITKNGD